MAAVTYNREVILNNLNMESMKRELELQKTKPNQILELQYWI